VCLPAAVASIDPNFRPLRRTHHRGRRPQVAPRVREDFRPTPRSFSPGPEALLGVRRTLFPTLAFGAHLSVAASFPTPFSTASGVSGLIAGPSSAFRSLNFE
jgi:hypothetical protein